MKCDRCRIGKMLRMTSRDGLLSFCKMVESCIFLDAVESGYPFCEVVFDDGRRGVVVDRLCRGEDYIRQALPFNIKAINDGSFGGHRFTGDNK